MKVFGLGRIRICGFGKETSQSAYADSSPSAVAVHGSLTVVGFRTANSTPHPYINIHCSFRQCMKKIFRNNHNCDNASPERGGDTAGAGSERYPPREGKEALRADDGTTKFFAKGYL